MLGITHVPTAFFVDRGIWLFCSGIENAMADAANRAKTSAQGDAARTQVLMQYLHPGETQGRFRDPAAGSGGAETVKSGEAFFRGSTRKRRN